MATTENNWAYNKNLVSESDLRLLEKAHKQENKKMQHGYRWVSAYKNLKVFVPCDKDGEPTDKGKRMIEAHLKAFGVIK